MLESYFVAPKTLRQLRAGQSGPYVDGFATSPEGNGYCQVIAIRQLMAAVHLGHFAERRSKTLADVDMPAYPRGRLPGSRR
jgi:hypothetical protein